MVSIEELFNEYVDARYEEIKKKNHLVHPDDLKDKPVILVDITGQFRGEGDSGQGQDDFDKVKAKLGDQYSSSEEQNFFSIVNPNSYHWEVVRHYKNQEGKWNQQKINCRGDGACGAHAILNVVLNSDVLISNATIKEALVKVGFVVENGEVKLNDSKFTESTDSDKALDFLTEILRKAKGFGEGSDQKNQRIDKIISNLSNLKKAIAKRSQTSQFWVESDCIVYFAEVAGVEFVNEGRIVSQADQERSKSDFRDNIIQNLKDGYPGEISELADFIKRKKGEPGFVVQGYEDNLQQGLTDFAKQQGLKDSVEIGRQDAVKDSVVAGLPSVVDLKDVPDDVKAKFGPGGEFSHYDLGSKINIALDLQEFYSSKGVSQQPVAKTIDSARGGDVTQASLTRSELVKSRLIESARAADAILQESKSKTVQKIPDDQGQDDQRTILATHISSQSRIEVSVNSSGGKDTLVQRLEKILQDQEKEWQKKSQRRHEASLGDGDESVFSDAGPDQDVVRQKESVVIVQHDGVGSLSTQITSSEKPNSKLLGDGIVNEVVRVVDGNRIEVATFKNEPKSLHPLAFVQEKAQKVIQDAFKDLQGKVNADDIKMFVGLMNELYNEKIKSQDDFGRNVGFGAWKDDLKSKLSSKQNGSADIDETMKKFQLISSKIQEKSYGHMDTASHLKYGEEGKGARSYRVCQLLPKDFELTSHATSPRR